MILVHTGKFVWLYLPNPSLYRHGICTVGAVSPWNKPFVMILVHTGKFVWRYLPNLFPLQTWNLYHWIQQRLRYIKTCPSIVKSQSQMELCVLEVNDVSWLNHQSEIQCIRCIHHPTKPNPKMLSSNHQKHSQCYTRTFQDWKAYACFKKRSNHQKCSQRCARTFHFVISCPRTWDCNVRKTASIQLIEFVSYIRQRPPHAYLMSCTWLNHRPSPYKSGNGKWEMRNGKWGMETATPKQVQCGCGEL